MQLHFVSRNHVKNRIECKRYKVAFLDPLNDFKIQWTPGYIILAIMHIRRVIKKGNVASTMSTTPLTYPADEVGYSSGLSGLSRAECRIYGFILRWIGTYDIPLWKRMVITLIRLQKWYKYAKTVEIIIIFSRAYLYSIYINVTVHFI